MMFEIEEVTERSRWESLRTEWNQALAESTCESVFLTHEWLSTWWNHWGSGHELFVLMAREGSKIRALAPLMRSKKKVSGLPVRKIQFIGGHHANLLDFIVPEQSRAAAEALAKHMIAASRWHVIDLHNVPAGSLAREAVLSATKEDSSVFLHEETFETFRISLDGDWDSYLKTRKSHLRRNLRRVERCLADAGQVEAESFSKPPDIRGAFEKVLQVDEKSRTRDQGFSAFLTPEARSFYNDLVGELAPHGWSLISLLKLNGDYIAYEFSLIFDGVVFGVLKAYDASFASLSPGIGLSTRVLQTLLGNGLREMDLFRGAGEYKHRWATSTNELKRMLIVRKSSYPRTIYRLWLRARDLKERKAAQRRS